MTSPDHPATQAHPRTTSDPGAYTATSYHVRAPPTAYRGRRSVPVRPGPARSGRAGLPDPERVVVDVEEVVADGLDRDPRVRGGLAGDAHGRAAVVRSPLRQHRRPGPAVVGRQHDPHVPGQRP